ncbi:VOC family protein [Nocardioides sp. zg-ZUI104]|uniref:VOC family protein n=1 Tax=Nocardioides faecalis TaxID=2803858 RepID=UPI001BD05F42|nr:VOC family protein [Nocardioides faecalis]MBS4751484.1 VOC family protein [Nocardioides faecalis]
MTRPTLRNVVLDTTDVSRLARFYRDLLDWSFHPDNDPEDATWQVLVAPDGFRLAFQRAERVEPTTWPDPQVPQQIHLDWQLATRAGLDELYARALQLGATLRMDQAGDPEEPLRVYVDPGGHTFCLFTHDVTGDGD